MKHPVIYFFTLAGSIFAMDQYLKQKIDRQAPDQFPRKSAHIPVTIHRSHNPGVFMNLLARRPRASSWLSTGAFGLFCALYLPALWKKCSGLYITGTALVWGGALSNVRDHIRRGYVVDYFSLPFRPIRHIIFNLGDCSIFAGLSLLICDAFHSR